ncbi:hypothetical protein [Pleurocapsa sp. FMAR1]|uniref:hypothetical protein n=1 Tax=Pleurocapsa sp. FMAR1 TaxID=3040204 RepID=UPI0029C700B2|nr:hypothetical protein [Pleurocapsa sp. FMAR1]
MISRNKNLLLGGAVSLFLLGSTVPAIALSREPSQYIAQSRTIEARSAQEKTLYLNNNRVYYYDLIATQSGTIGNVTVPVGATIEGKYVPTEGGLRYVAQNVTYGKYTYPVNAESQTLADVKDPRDTSAGSVAEDAGIGAAGGAVLGELFGGKIKVGEALGGAAAGAAVGNITADRVVVVKPDDSITLYNE